MDSPDTDADIVAKSLTEKEAFAVLISRYEGKLSRYIARLGIRDEEDRSDVLQNVFIKVYQNLNAYDSSLSFSSWIYRIAHNEAISFFRAKKVRPEGNLIEEGEEVLNTLAHDAEIVEGVDARIDATHLTTALSMIDRKYREVLVLRFFEERDYSDISDILEIPMGSVATLIHRAKKALAKEVAHIQ